MLTSLAIESEADITVLLVERDGSTRWRSIGTWSAEKEESLGRVVSEEGGGAARAR